MAGSRPLRSVPDQPGRVVLYRRVSAIMGRGDEEFLSPDLQDRAMRQMAAGNGLRVVGTADDIDVTGRTFSRAGLDEVRAMVEAGQVDVVAVYDLSRLGRNTAEALTFVRWLRDHDVSIISTKEQIDDTPEGHFMLSMWLSMAQMYSDQMARRWEEVIAFRAREGKAHGSRPTIGYLRAEIPDSELRRSGRRPTRIVVDPVLGDAVAEAFEDYASGTPLVRIAEKLSRAADRTVDYSTLRRALHNPFYLGKAVLWGLPKGRRHPKVGDEPALVAPGEHKALVEEAVWEKVQRRLRRESATPERRHLALGWSLAGLVFCAHCELPLQLHTAKVGAATEKVARLRCGAGSRARRVDCPGPGTPHLDRVEAAVLEEVARWATLLRVDATQQARQRSRVVTLAAEQEALASELHLNRAQQAKLVERWLDGKIPEVAYETNIARLTSAERGLRERLQDVADEPPPPDPAAANRLATEVVDLWPAARADQRRRLLATVVRRVLVRRPGYWREPVRDRVVVEFVY